MMSGGSRSALPGPSETAMLGSSASAMPGSSESAELEFPPLISLVSTDSQKIEHLMKEVEYLMKETESQKKEIESQKKETESQKKETESQKKEIESQKKEIESQKKETESQKKETESQKKETESQKKETESLKKETESLMKEIESEKKKTKSQKKEIESQKKETKSLKKETESLKKETESQKKEVESQKKETESQKKEHMKVREFTKIWCTRDLVICAGEIWKWSVLKHLGDGHISDGRHLWGAGVKHFVKKAAKAMQMTKQVREMKELSRECILARNNAAHFTTIKALDNAVLISEKAIAMFPDLMESHPSQCKTIVKYGRFKTFLKDNFK